jgi:hypothetical protein
LPGSPETAFCPTGGIRPAIEYFLETYRAAPDPVWLFTIRHNDFTTIEEILPKKR